MKTGKAAVMLGFNQPFEIREYPLPEELEEGAVLVKMLAAGICGTDVHTWMGQTGGKILNFPVILGHENVGEIIRIKGEVNSWDGKKLEVGDRITWPTTIGTYCYSCYNCTVVGKPNKCLNRKTYGAALSCVNPPHFFGGWAEYCYLFPRTSLFKLPQDLSPEALVATGCAVPTMIHAVEESPLRVGDSVVIQGSGAVGLFGLVVALEAGAGQVIMVGGPGERLELAKKWGAHHVVDINEVKDPAERVRVVKELSASGYGADVLFECSGIPDTVSEGIQMIRDGGTMVSPGQFMNAGPAKDYYPFYLTFKNATMKGSYSWEPRHTYRAVELVNRIKSKYPLGELVSHKYPLEKITEAVIAVKEWKVVKAIIDFSL